MKRIIILFLGLSLGYNAYSQRHAMPGKDTLVYYMTYGDRQAKNKQWAHYVMFIMPLDSSSGEKVYPVAEYYTDGKPKLFAYSKTKECESLIFEGPYVSYSFKGYKERVMNYINGMPKGEFKMYYPNGKLYTDQFYDDNGRLLLVNCQDSVGNVLARDGNGNWIRYSTDFKQIQGKGIVKDSLENGKWYENYEDKDDTTVFEKGKVVSSTLKLRQLGICFYPQQTATFRGDFGEYLGKNIRYPAEAKENNQQGKVFVQFIVEKDGAVSYVHVIRTSKSNLLDNEAIRVIDDSSTEWKPALQNGVAVSSVITMPISFTLSTNSR
ncbi:MAG: TonB family protein [Mucilaginibacter sp.]